MTMFYPDQPASQFLKKFSRKNFNHAHYEAQMHGGDGQEDTSLALQPYRTTPLILPGAKVNQQRNLPTESYLRHHPNPQMRGPAMHDYSDTMMKQKVADSVLQRYNGDESANGPKVVHKQFNSPIGLYSDNNIENTIKGSVPMMSPAQSVGSSSVPIFVDMSFLEHKKRILAEQAEIQRHNQQNKTYYGSSYSQKPQFNQPLYNKTPFDRPQSAATPQMFQHQQAPSNYPPAYYPNSRFSFNQQ